jgi:hypothetical protein
MLLSLHGAWCYQQLYGWSSESDGSRTGIGQDRLDKADLFGVPTVELVKCSHHMACEMRCDERNNRMIMRRKRRRRKRRRRMMGVW